MKAITIYQPYASLIAVKAKNFETRSWYTPYRGTIAIHAAKKRLEDTLKEIFPDDTTLQVDFVSTMLKLLGDESSLPHGAIIAKAVLVGCHKIEYRHIPNAPIKLGYWKDSSVFTGKILWCDISEQEQLFGDWSEGRYAWEFANVQREVSPTPVRGKQGIWNWDDR